MEKRVHSCYVLGSKFLRNFVLALLIIIFFFIYLFQAKLLRNNEVYYFDYAGDDDSCHTLAAYSAEKSCWAFIIFKTSL